MMTDYSCDKEQDTTPLWAAGRAFSGLSRFKHWLFPAVTATVILILIIILGATNTKMSNRLWTVEQKESNLSNIIQNLNSSLQQAHESAREVKKLQFAVENNKDQLRTVSEALKQLSVVDSLSRSVSLLKCSLERIIKNTSVVDGCCPPGWEQFSSFCYYFSSQSLSWNDSRVWCDQHQAHLLILHDDKAWDFVTARTDSYLFWIGLSDWRTGQWEWVNQTPYIMDRRRWVPGQPDSWAGHGLGPGDEDCAHLHRNGRLNDVHCTTKMRFVCQKQSIRD